LASRGIQRHRAALTESTVGAENRFNEFERFNVNIEAAVATTLAGGKVNLGVRLNKCEPPHWQATQVVALPF